MAKTRITTGGGSVTAGQAALLVDYLLPPAQPDYALADTPELAWLAPDWDGVYAQPAPEFPDTPEMPPDMPEGAPDALGGAGVGKGGDLPIGVNDAPPAPPQPRQRDLPEFGVCLTRGCGRRSVRAGRCQYCGDWEWQRIWGGVSNINETETGRPPPPSGTGPRKV